MRHVAELVPIDSLKPYKGNPRRGNIDVIRESLRVNKQYRPVVVRARTREVLAGNHTLLAAQAEGWSELWATFVNVDAKTAKRIVLVDNRSNDLAGYDNSELVSLLGALPSLEGTGYSDGDLAELLAIEGEGQDTEPMAAPEKPRTKLGDMYVLGEHRLLCGDATVAEDVARLMDGAKADLVLTDPPYGIDANKMTLGLGKKEFARGADWDAAPVAVAWLLDVAPQVIVWGGNYYAHDLPVTNDWLCWHKNNDGRSFGEFELAWTNLGRQTRHLTHHWGGEEKRHPTQKPTAVMDWCLRVAHSPRGAVVLDPFCGSGSTLIACENLSRRCYAMEIDPGYCDVIVDRYERHTGQEARLASDTAHT